MFNLLPLKHIRYLTSPLIQKEIIKQSLRYTSSKSSGPKTISSIKEKDAQDEIFFPPVKVKELKDKVALVTGGNEEIGLKCVTELLECGAKGVMIADVSVKKGATRVMELSKKYGAKSIAFIQINPASYDLLKNAFISTFNFYKGLDIVINCVKLKDKNWEDQVDENIKALVLSTQLSLEFMDKNNGGNGGILLNIISDYCDKSESCPLFLAVQEFIAQFDRSLATTHCNSDVKVLTICKATLDSITCDLATVLTKGSSGCVWIADHN